MEATYIISRSLCVWVQQYKPVHLPTVASSRVNNTDIVQRSSHLCSLLTQ